MAPWFTVVSLSARLEFRNGLQVDGHVDLDVMDVALDVMDRQRLGRDRDGVSSRKLSKLSESDSKVRGVMGMKRYHSRGGIELLPLAESNLYLELKP